MKNKKLEVVVDRKKWSRGGDSGSNLLLDEKGKMCCLGFAVAQLCNLPRTELLGVDSPSDLRHSDMPSNAATYNLGKLIRIEDDAIIWNDQKLHSGKICVIISSSKEREDKLIEVFSREKITLKFKN